MLTLKHMLTCVMIQDWLAAKDLKDTYFHVSILPMDRLFLLVCHHGQAYQYEILSFGLPRLLASLPVSEAALVSLKDEGIHILNYVYYRMILIHSERWFAHTGIWCSNT